MPGIVGIIAKEATAPDPTVLKRMLQPMLHEPFYTSGSLVEPGLGAAVGWVCHQGAFSDCLPVWNEERTIGIIFSGEHFPTSEDDPLLPDAKSPERHTAAHFARAYEKMGARFFEALNGTFSGVVLDLRERQAILFNDRFGLGRVYYHEAPCGLYFASEAKALLAVLPKLRCLQPRALAEVIACGSPLQHRSLFEGVALLPPASRWSFRPGQLDQRERYFNLTSWEQQEQISPEVYYRKLCDTLGRVIPRHFEGRQPVAMSLTGGLDSRLVVAWGRRPAGTLPCYTFDGMFRECADARVAKQLAGVINQPHQVIRVGREFLAEFPTLAERAVYLTDGAMDVSGAPGLFVHRQAREIAPVRMTGNYGDELLRGNICFKAADASSPIFDPGVNKLVAEAKSTFEAERRGTTPAFIAGKQVPWYHFSRLALEQSQLTVRTPFVDSEVAALAFQAPGSLAANRELALRAIAAGSPALDRVATDRGSTLWRKFVPFKLLHFWQEIIPRAEYSYDYGMPGWFAKLDRVAAPLHLENWLLGWQKYYHFRLWYRRELAHHVKRVLLDEVSLSRPYLNRTAVERIVHEHCSGAANHTLAIHRLLSLEIIHRRLIRECPSSPAVFSLPTNYA